MKKNNISTHFFIPGVYDAKVQKIRRK